MGNLSPTLDLENDLDLEHSRNEAHWKATYNATLKWLRQTLSLGDNVGNAHFKHLTLKRTMTFTLGTTACPRLPMIG